MSKAAKREPIILPALRGIMGDWVYYSALMQISEVSNRVSYANEIHKNKNLSDMIQRQLKGSRSKEIATYIHEQSERFFNSLVIATYDGEPNWYAVSGVSAENNSLSTDDLSEETLASVGFLTLRGDENLFAIDGQHRLSGIKKACRDGLDQEPLDELSVIFVAHKQTTKGHQRTRRLFTTLNKTAKPVSKGDIIALDEDDVMAICARRLIEKTDKFGGTRIAFVANNNLPSGNFHSLTTIGNLYDVLTAIFSKIPSPVKEKPASLKNFRPPEERLDEFFAFAEEFFATLGKNFTELDEFFKAKDTEPVVKKYRGSHGGSALFRPIGIQIFVEIIARLAKVHSVSEAIKIAGKLPRTLDEKPFAGLMWDTSTQTILNAHKVTLRELLSYMVGCSTYSEERLIDRYSKALGVEETDLPDRVI
jgi:DNA sulfur modification protein DndB